MAKNPNPNPNPKPQPQPPKDPLAAFDRSFQEWKKKRQNPAASTASVPLIGDVVSAISASPISANPTVVEVFSGVLFAKKMADGSRQVFLVVAEDMAHSGKWLVAPLSMISEPGLTEDIRLSTWDDSSVLQLWNTRSVEEAKILSTDVEYVGSLDSSTDLIRCWNILQHIVKGTPLTKADKVYPMPPLNGKADPRNEYLNTSISRVTSALS